MEKDGEGWRGMEKDGGIGKERGEITSRWKAAISNQALFKKIILQSYNVNSFTV